MRYLLGVPMLAGLLTVLALGGPHTASTPRAPLARLVVTPADSFGLVLAASTDLGAVASSQPLALLLTVPDPTAARLSSDIAALYTPGSARFGHYLSAAQAVARYGPAAASIARVGAMLARWGLRIHWQRGSSWLTVTGSAAQMEAAFGVPVHWFRAATGRRFYANIRPPVATPALRPLLASLGHISNYNDARTLAVPVGGLQPSDVMASYDIAPLRAKGLDGSGQTVVFFELNDGYVQSDFDAFTQKLGLPAIAPVLQGGSTPPQTAGGETEMDIEVVHEIAPGAKIVIYNIDPTSATNQQWIDLQQKMVRDNPGAIISQSWGGCESSGGAAYSSAMKAIYDQADTLGESVFVSSGDSGAYQCMDRNPRGTPPGPTVLGVSLPASAPGVTGVGGTRISVTPQGGWYNETVWEAPSQIGGGGGGVSAVYPMPTWQSGPGVLDPTYNPHTMRGVPDVAANSDPASAMAIYVNGKWTAEGGTSQAAPIWAGIAALLNHYLSQQGLHAAGFMNPALYQIAAHPTPYQAFHDITVGTNLYYPAHAGYDLATGLGTPDAWNLAQDLVAYQKGGGK